MIIHRNGKITMTAQIRSGICASNPITRSDRDAPATSRFAAVAPWEVFSGFGSSIGGAGAIDVLMVGSPVSTSAWESRLELVRFAPRRAHDDHRQQQGQDEEDPADGGCRSPATLAKGLVVHVDRSHFGLPGGC